MKTNTKTRTREQAATEQDAPALECRTYTVERAGELLGIGRSLAYDLAKEGTLPGVRRLGRRYVVSRAAFDAWLDRPNVVA